MIPWVSAQYEGKGKDETVREFEWPNGKRCAVSLTFDDGRASQIDNGIPILNRYGVHATFYVSPKPVAERIEDWRLAVVSGHEIGNHSMNHPCTGNFRWSRHKALEDQTLETIARDIDSANRHIEDLLGLVPQTFAYPCGQKFVGRGKRLQSYVPVVAERFLAGRGWLDETPNDPEFCDLAQLLGMELDGLTFNEVRSLMDGTAKRGVWLVFAGHDIGGGGQQTVLESTLEAICKYATEPVNGIWIDTVQSVAQYIRAQRTAD